MSVSLSIELVVTGPAEVVKAFWAVLNPNNDKVNSNHFQRVLGQTVDPSQDPFDSFDVRLDETWQSISISWSGGFGDFDRGYLGSTFRDSGVELSERFPTLEFTLYFDSHGQEFAGGYGSEIIDEHGNTARVYAGGIRYRAGVRIGEKTLTDAEYFIDCGDAGIGTEDPGLEDIESEDDSFDDEFEDEFADDVDFPEPDYDNNRQKIEAGLANGDLRPSTLYFRNNWLERSLNDAYAGACIPGKLSFRRSFWKEVPLVNTPAAYVDETIVRAAIQQCPHSLIFVPDNLITDQELYVIKNNDHLLAIFGSFESDATKGITLIKLLALHLMFELSMTDLAQSYLAESDIGEPESEQIPEQSAQIGDSPGTQLKRQLINLVSAVEHLDPEAAQKIARLSTVSFTLETPDQLHPEALSEQIRPLFVDVIRLFCGQIFDDNRD